jgi:hypothetical protein
MSIALDKRTNFEHLEVAKFDFEPVSLFKSWNYKNQQQQPTTLQTMI